MKKTLLLLAILFSGFCFAQNEVNNYKYVIIPEKFEFLREPNKYNMNALTKMVFDKYGFTTFYTNDKLPDELALNKCLALYGDLVNESGMLNTKIVLTLKDCSGKVVFTSQEGSSKEKDYKKAYYEALREASLSIAELNYKYAGPVTVATTTTAVQPVSPASPVTPSVAVPIPVSSENQLFAQPIANGFQLVDTTPKVVVKMYKTSQQDYYTAQGDNKNGVIFKKGNDWFFEYYLNDKLVSEKLNIKF